MAAIPRIQSSTNIYHVVLCGNNMQRIFEEQADYEKFMSTLLKYKKECGFALYAWCLMSNHIHLLLKEKTDPLCVIFQKINTSFVKWYNLKYERRGHLFQERYFSEPVEDAVYLLRAVRYVHLNPVKGGLCKTPDAYRYSSYANYFLSGRYKDSDMILGLMRKDDFEQYHREKNDDICLDIDNCIPQKLTDEEASQLISMSFGCERISQIQQMPYAMRNQAVIQLLQAGGSLRQISRLTGISIRVIRNIKENAAPEGSAPVP